MGGRSVCAASKSFHNLNQKDIVKVMSPGWNLGNQMEAIKFEKDTNTGITKTYPSETAWGNPVITEEMIKTVKAAGFKSVRIPVSYFSYIGNAPDYTINAGWLSRVKEVVDMCVKNDLYAVINIHGDGYTTIDGGWLHCGSWNQAEIQAKYVAVWKQIAQAFKGYDEHLIFESMNEEGDDKADRAFAYRNINTYQQLFVDTVRKTGGNNAKRWLIVCGWLTDIDKTCEGYFEIPSDKYRSKEVPNNEKRIMISVHYYSPWEFCGNEDYQISEWGSYTKSKNLTAQTNETYLKTQFDKLLNKFTSKGYPVFVGEFGSCDKTKTNRGNKDNNIYRAYFAKILCENCVRTNCIPMYWDNGWNGEFGFAVFDRRTHKITQKEIIDAIMGVYK
ncbi:glycoside hydrolase family 5 protein [Anaerosacchariphilus polymeriproducens]|uniref:Glycoside hydrolase family 5 protein n=2 Tax=Anaerosacchariphilus polymeriproducens TaxID=1812858 RepID=A0A371AYT3_9FIRM|nr:glycoside hydrolase family 5 protein [Anaerosacchariphilus polymeriproducens]